MPSFPTLSLQPSYPIRCGKFPSTISSDKEAGYVFTRARFTRNRQWWELQYGGKVPAEDWYVMKAFEDTVQIGAVAFDWPNPEEAYGSLAWQAGHVYAAGEIVRPASPNGRSYICIVGGLSHATTEPVWPTTVGGTVVDNAATWRENTYSVRFDHNGVQGETVDHGRYDMRFRIEQV